MSITSKALSAGSKLIFVILLLAAFIVGMTSVVYISLSGTEVKVPDIVGKDFVESEKELSALGLKIKKRADRSSTEKINTVIEQSPKAGETLKTGNMIFVVVSKAGVEGETPVQPKPDTETDDTEKIEEMISEKPKKAKANSNTSKKKVDTTRDSTNESNSNSDSNSDSNSSSDDHDKKEAGKDSGPAAKNRNTSTGPVMKPQPTPAGKSPAAKPPGGEMRSKPPVKP
ncbi:MAG TPA: PASTA domain-containing protein [Pyrinomonadaceae bacterium]|nr:PASTA domain-containing protein [Pyrinomonadaceae bacterium]